MSNVFQTNWPWNCSHLAAYQPIYSQTYSEWKLKICRYQGYMRVKFYIFVTVPQLYLMVYSHIPPTFHAVNTNLYRRKQKVLPHLLQISNTFNIHLQDDWRITEASNDFLHDVKQTQGIFIFTTENNIELLTKSSLDNVLETVNIFPHLFHQLYVLVYMVRFKGKSSFFAYI